MDQLTKTMRKSTLAGTLGLKMEEKQIVKNSFNCLPDEPKKITKLINKVVNESKVNSNKTSA